jgi:hypothetical protein
VKARCKAVESYYDYVLASDRWVRLRARLLSTRGRRCQLCGASESYRSLELHHLTYDRLGFEHDDDLQVLCSHCHYAADRERSRHTRSRSWTLWIAHTHAIAAAGPVGQGRARPADGPIGPRRESNGFREQTAFSQAPVVGYFETGGETFRGRPPMRAISRRLSGLTFSRARRFSARKTSRAASYTKSVTQTRQSGHQYCFLFAMFLQSSPLPRRQIVVELRPTAHLGPSGKGGRVARPG